MTLTPNFLPVGSIVEYNSGQCDDENWNPISISITDIEDLIGNPKIFNDYYRPIPLTPEILTEWCGFGVKDMGSSRLFYIGMNPITHDYLFDLTWLDKPELINSPNAPFYRNGAYHIYFLHQLQHLYSALTQTVLPITIK